MHIFRANHIKTVVRRLNQQSTGYNRTIPAGRWVAAGNRILLVILSLSILGSLRAGVEQVQRDFQARYHLVTGNYLQWPQCSSGQTPAPQYPKDSFYGDLTEDPDKGVELVQDLVQKFYSDNIIYTYFINAPNGYSDLDNVASINNYTVDDMQPVIQASAVNTNNYLAELQIVAVQLGKLKLIKVQGTQTTTSGDTKISEYANVLTNLSATCSSIESCVANNHSSTAWGQYAWGPYANGQYATSDCQFMGSEPVGNLDWLSDIIRVGFESGANVIGTNRQYMAAAWNTRGKITADLEKYKKGTSKIYLKLTKPSCDANARPYVTDFGAFTSSCTSTFGGSRPTSAEENHYGLWADGNLQLGAVSTSDYVTYSDTLESEVGSCLDEALEVYGWSVADAVAIVAPDFTSVPDPQDCCACSTCEAGTTEASLQSIHVNIGLGGDNFDGSAGALTLEADQPTLALATPSALRYSVAGNVEVIIDSSTNHLQFKTSQTLANILTNNAYKYTISLFTATDAGTKDGSGFYQPTGTAFTTVVLENPDATNSVYNRLRITRTSDSSSVTDYIYNSTNVQWEMDTGGGLRKETRFSVWDANNTVRTETVAVSNATNQLVYKEINTYQRFPWGQERVQNVVDPDGAALTNTWTFYTNSASDGGNYRQLKQEVDAKGHWATHQYDEEGRETNRVTQFLNSAIGSVASSNRATTTIYSTNAPQITIVETLLGSEIGREYKVVGSGEVDHYRCQTPGAAWNAADNLLTITKKYTTGSFARRLQRVQNPNGTVEIYSYSTNATQMTNTVLSGVPDPNNSTNILVGTKTITVTALGGKILSRTVAYVVAGSGDLTTDQDTYTYLDDRNRSYQVVHLDGTTNSFYYACCGLDSEVDRDGTTTQYFYDALKRQTASLRNGITITNLLDAADRVQATIRIGTNGAWNTLGQTAYDVSGRITTQTNALNGITAFSEGFDANGYFVKTNVFPDTGTRIESYFKDGSLAKLTGTAVHPVRYTNSVELESGTNRFFTQEIKLDASGNDTSEWTKTYYDAIKRPYKTVFAKSTSPYPYSQSFYNVQGQLSKQVDADGVTILYQYNPKRELAYSALDTNRDGTINFAGNDRITWTTNYVTTNYGTTIRRTQNYAWSTGGTDASNLVSTVETSADGLRTWNIPWNAGAGVTNQSQTVYAGGGNRYVTTTAPDGSYTVTAFSYGRLSSVTRKDALNNQLSAINYLFDAHGRVLTTTDARNGATTYLYNNADQVTAVTTPAPGTGQGPQTTRNYFDNMGRATNVFLADLTTVTNEYYLTGELRRTFGSRSYPVGYGYDAQGRMKTMTNWTSFAASTGTRVTTWNYDGYRGFLTNKVYDGGSAGPSYTYTPAGRLQTRAWARGITTTNSYNNNGELLSTSYSDATPTVTMVYDRRGRAATVTNGTAVCALAYNDANQLLSETNSAGTLAGLWVTNTYDSYLRRSQITGKNGSTTLNSAAFAYDYASRLTNATDGTSSAGYSYLANSLLISQITFRQSGSTKMTTTKQYDYLNRLLSISSSPSSSSSLPISYAYGYNDANQRTRVALTDASYWIYQYDALRQVTSGKKYFSDNTPVPGQQFEYGFDDIGNRASTKAGGDQSGAGLRPASYAANSLNQYANRTVPSAFDVIGIASASSSVAVNSSAADYRRGEYFQELVGVNNSSTSVWQNVSVTTSGGGTNSGNVFVPTATETYGHDADGNMTNDGRWTFTWDAENRLVSMQGLNSVPSGAKKKLDFTYDYGGRRIQKIVSTWNGTAYVALSTNKFVYDAWNLVAELNGTNGLIRSYIWGLDLSGGMQGAGGVGGLLAIKPTGTNTLFVACDGNGNVTGLIDATTGATSGQFEYGPFGETLRLTPNANNQSPFRFSTKYTDDDSDFVYYGFRYYNPSTGRWLSRDPIEERGGPNLYLFAGNDAVANFDFLGFIVGGPPMPSPATPPSAAMESLFTNFLGMPSNHQTSWFNTYRLEATQNALAYHYLMIQRQKKALCMLRLEEYQSFYVKGNLPNERNDEFVKYWGHPPNIWGEKQNFADKVWFMGDYEYRLAVFAAKKDGRMVYWKATIELIDILGWQESYENVFGMKTLKPLLTPVVGGQREIRRASWNLEGEICCE